MGHAQAVQEVCQSLFPIYMTRRKACRIQVSTAIQGGIRPAALGRVGCRYRNILLHMATLHARTTTSTRLVSSSQLAAGDSAASRLSSSRLRVTAEDEATQVLEAKVGISIAKGGGQCAPAYIQVRSFSCRVLHFAMAAFGRPRQSFGHGRR